MLFIVFWLYLRGITTRKSCRLSLFQSGSTTGIQIWWATGSSIPKLVQKVVFFPTSSWIGWNESSPSRTLRSGWSTRSEFRPSMESAPGPGVSRSTAGPESLVRMLVCVHTPSFHKRVLIFGHCFHSVPASGPTNVSAFATTSSRILVRWGEVPETDRNGLILGYKVCRHATRSSLQADVAE